MATTSNCRCCEQSNLHTVLSLGELPLANALLQEQDLGGVEKRYPLDLAFCPECSLVQITETVDPEVLFGEYLYLSSYSETMLSHADKLAAMLIEKQGLSKNSLVIEIASNDGYLLQYFKQKDIPVLGIEPAENIAKAAKEKDIPTLCKFFNTETAEELKRENRMGDLIIGNNVLAHVADLSGFVEGVSILLNADGTAVFEFPYVRDMIQNVEFDTIYHEHLCYYSLTAVKNLFARHSLAVTDVERIGIHGGSLRIYVQHDRAEPPKNTVRSLLDEERDLLMTELVFYDSFANKVLCLKREMSELLKELKSKGGKIIAYGAAAKGSTLLNYFGIGKDCIDYIVDRSPYKQGRYMTGSHLPIVAPDEIKQTKPDYVLILPWNLKDEIMAQQAFIRQWGGKFIVPIPNVTVI
ncbi:class I SAM-dependent methyltransferase [Candidatus Pacearchaeota archaeon]|nr:class I SAM-dependent methyltransferase [Candidatus Pacearchaeota archaeon]